jgi:hypothetical protein
MNVQYHKISKNTINQNIVIRILYYLSSIFKVKRVWSMKIKNKVKNIFASERKTLQDWKNGLLS